MFAKSLAVAAILFGSLSAFAAPITAQCVVTDQEQSFTVLASEELTLEDGKIQILYSSADGLTFLVEHSTFGDGKVTEVVDLMFLSIANGTDVVASAGVLLPSGNKTTLSLQGASQKVVFCTFKN